MEGSNLINRSHSWNTMYQCSKTLPTLIYIGVAFHAIGKEIEAAKLGNISKVIELVLGRISMYTRFVLELAQDLTLCYLSFPHLGNCCTTM